MIQLFFVSLVALAAGTQPLAPEVLKKYQACSDTSNCIRVDNGCCDCANNGSTVAIAQKFEKEFRANFDCKKMMCTQRAGECQFQEPICVNGFCELGKQKKLFPKK